MGQKVNPIGFRLGINRSWDSVWYARNSYGAELLEDLKVRRYLDKVLKNAEVAKIEIEKAGDAFRVVIHSCRPGVVIGRKGQEIKNIREAVFNLLSSKRDVEVSVQEVRKPELDATAVANSIAEQLTRRGSYKRLMKRASAAAMKAGARGIKICCSGRLGGAEIARSECSRAGSVPMHTLRADIDYHLGEAKTKYGMIGVKVWICRGEFSRGGNA